MCRRMQPPTEAHLRLVEQEGGGFTVDSVDCPRVYHLNLVLRVRSRAAKRRSGRLMQLSSARIVADQARCAAGPCYAVRMLALKVTQQSGDKDPD